MFAAKALAVSLLITQVQFTNDQQPLDFSHLKESSHTVPVTSACKTMQRSPVINVIAQRGEPTYSAAENISSLTGKSTSGNAYRPQGVSGPAWHTQGLTQSRFDYAYNFPMMVTDMGNGLVCIEVKQIDFTITLSPQVWVANEFPPGSCMYNAVKQHEDKHVNVDRIVTNQHLDRIRAAMTEASLNQTMFGPAKQDVVQSVFDQFRGQMIEVMNDEIKSLQQDDNRMQRQVDTLQEYQRVANQCPGQWGR